MEGGPHTARTTLSTLSSQADAEPRHNLPARTTSFVGRRAELDQLAVQLGDHRVVTVTGAGGSGKTRLAIELARSLIPRFEMGVWLVELGHLDDAALVPSAVAAVLGIRQQPGKSVPESLVAGMSGRHALLVIDNCEHVAQAAAELCDLLVLAGDDLRILATSRELLGVSGEARFLCPPLGVPVDDSSSGSDAVALFLDRARQVDVGFTLTPEAVRLSARLVRQLDGMPLAIELAAAQLDVLMLDQLVDSVTGSLGVLVNRTRGSAARQASLAASIDWSYRLLDDAEKAAFRRLAVFPAPFTEAAAVAAAGHDAAALLPRLVRRSMLHAPRRGSDGEPRYGMLETLKTFGRALLEEAGEHIRVRMAVADWLTATPERASEGLDLGQTEQALTLAGTARAVAATQVPGPAGADLLTARERELLELVAAGLTDKEIAQQLFISIRTVRSHLDRIRDKTGCRRRADMTRLALASAAGLTAAGYPGCT